MTVSSSMTTSQVGNSIGFSEGGAGDDEEDE